MMHVSAHPFGLRARNPRRRRSEELRAHCRARGTTNLRPRRATSDCFTFSGGVDGTTEAVRLVAARHAIAAFETREPVTTWIIDDTGFRSRASFGRRPAAIQWHAPRQDRVQIGVSLSVATSGPESWTEDAARRAEIPSPKRSTSPRRSSSRSTLVETPWQPAFRARLSSPILSTGSRGCSREAVRGQLGLDYGVATRCDTKAWLPSTPAAIAAVTTCAWMTSRSNAGSHAFRRP